jgi:hypothetical protein
LGADGHVRLEQRHVGSFEAWVGYVTRPTLQRLVDGLAEAAFPAVPPHGIPPGATRVLVLRGRSGDLHTPPMAWHAGGRLPGYDAVFHVLDSIIVELTAGRIPMIAKPESGLVRVAPATTRG